MENNYCTLKNSKLIWKIYKIDKGKVYLEMNNKKMITDIGNIVLLNNYTPLNDISINFNIDSEKNTTSEIMLRHKTKEDALFELDKFMDAAICANLPKVKIIHGKNGGILRKAVHEYLDNSPFVSSYSLGMYHEGGIGVTIAYLKKYN